MRRVLAIVGVLAIAGAVDAEADSAAQTRCGTPALLPALASRPRIDASAVPLTANGDKLTRDGFGAGYTTKLTNNFAVKWRDPSVTDAEAQLVADSLEKAWSKYIVELGHDVCTGCGTYRLNAYIARPADSPSIEFSGGYAWIDDEGYPFFVISRDVFELPRAAERVQAIAVHEFYHDVQFSTGAFAWGEGEHGWFWEATAEWAAQETLPELPDPFLFVGALAVKSELPLYYYGDALGGDAVSGLHQYGASLFFRYATQTLGDPALVVDAWKHGAPRAEPLATIAAELPPDRELPALYGEFAAHAAVWDYPEPQRAFIVDSIAQYQQMYAAVDPIAARVPAEGIAMTTLVRPPYGYGYAVIELARPATGRFEVEARISSSGAATLQGAVVYGAPGAATYEPLAIADGTTGSAQIDLPDDIDVAYLVVSTITDERVTGDPIPLAYRVTPVERDDVGAGCDAGGGGAGWLVLGALVAPLAQRRRRPA
ncbi:MAG TPA: DUF6055 domain-containing protein [Kofleriaceae bacterium]|nr:DUF6055 domain-containing protein [Kofleriaceae bacterium]